MTHATDSTARKRVGCFAPQGLHVNKDTLRTLQTGSETTKNMFETDQTAEELYFCVDLYMISIACDFHSS